jgi:dethiobiotin synthetase
MPELDIFRDAFFDLSVINICAERYASRAVKGPLEGSKIRYEEKMRKYPELGSRFKPLVVESTGGWHQYSFDYLKNIADHIATKTNKSIVALSTILTTASVCLQRHQGAMLVRRCLGLF